MSKTSVKIIKNEVGCRDDTVPKTIDTRRHCGGLRACNNLPQPSPYILVFGGCGRLLHALNPPLCLLVSTVFGTVSSLHPTSFIMIFTLVYLIFKPETEIRKSCGKSSKTHGGRRHQEHIITAYYRGIADEHV